MLRGAFRQIMGVEEVCISDKMTAVEAVKVQAQVHDAPVQRLEPVQTEEATTDPKLEPETSRECPISMLSEELLTLILDMLRDLYDINDTGIEQDPRDAVPITASHVCRYWRFLSLDNPLWWSEILISSTTKLERLQVYLQRSKQCRLDLRIFGYRDRDYQSDRGSEESVSTAAHKDAYPSFFSELTPHFHRCRILQLSSLFSNEHNIPFSFLDNLLKVEMPHLEQFILEGDFDSYLFDIQRRGKMPLFASAPLLRDLRLTGIEIGTFTLPFTSLGHLHLSRSSATGQTSFTTLKRVLETLPNITNLAIYDDLLVRWPGISETCNVPSLEHLSIFGNMLSVSELLLFLKSPKLTDLTIAPIVVSDMKLLQSEYDSRKDFHSLFPNLTSLTLAPAFSEAFQAVDIASVCFPQIKRLVLANLYLIEFLETFTNKNRIVFPNLLDLALTDIDKDFIPVIRNLHQFRRAHDVPFKNIYVDSQSYQILVKEKKWSDSDSEQYGILEGNFWEEQRKKALHSDIKDLFVGRSRDSD